MKTQTSTRAPGFALIVTLSLMILLTVIAVGLLTLSTISLRSSGQGDAIAKARANAKMALLLAIGDLQKRAGPDTRITAPANLVNPSASAGITGVWKSWRPPAENPDYSAAKGGANFLGYLMSDPNPGTAPNPKDLPKGSLTAQQLVGQKSVGNGNPKNEIVAPLVAIAGSKANTPAGAFSWVTLDEGVKGRVDLLPSEDASGQGESITRIGSACRNGFDSADKMDFLKGDSDKLIKSLPKLVSLDQIDLATSSQAPASMYFHDFTVSSRSVQADVANGGLKTDLSVLFDGAYGTTLPASFEDRYLYSNTTAPYQGASSDVKWNLYADYARLYRKTAANDNPKVGFKATLPKNYLLKGISDATLKKTRYEPDMSKVKQPMLMPTVVKVDTVFTLVTHDSHAGHGTAAYPYMLHLMYLPVITLHNPYNTPLRVTNLQVEFADIPVGFEFLINNQPATTGGLLPINQMYFGGSGAKKTFNMQLSNSLSGSTEVVMGAGETRILGTPFPGDSTWGGEVTSNGNGKGFFDWQNNQTGGAFTIPGMITGQNDGVGFDVDWLAPANRAPWLVARKNNGVIILKADDDIKVRFGPVVPATAALTNAFSISVKLGGIAAATTQVFYANAGRLKTIMEEGKSPRFPDSRSFPETFPKATASPINTMSIYENNARKVKEYAKARPFAIFSVGAKTTMESFTKSRPVADTGVAFQMATCDFTTSESQGSSPLEFALIPVKSGGLVIESGGIQDSKKTSLQGFFFGGHGSIHGTNNASFYELPMAPLQSIAQLRHANGGSIGSAPYVTYTVGESRAHPAVPSAASFLKVDASRTTLDHSWLANDQLWDRYWFSTISTLQGPAYSGSAANTQDQVAQQFFAGTKRLPNARNSLYLPQGKTQADAVAEVKTADGSRSAAYVMTDGCFNVNSTSLAAWISVLSGLSKSDVPLASGTDEKNPPGAPFVRVRQPVKGLESGVSNREKLWNGYRTLGDPEITALATEIVAEVKARGPFLSMAEFVNRRLGSGGPSNKGAIQAAIDRTTINSIMESNATAVSPADAAGYGWTNIEAITGTTGAGAPGEISQGDILSAIGSFVSVRSDTFRIRAFGDARNAVGTVVAKAWCEATIQRVPAYVDGADKPEAIASVPVNMSFGRQFKVTAFRWLHPDEV